jgi:hypothetical protein
VLNGGAGAAGDAAGAVRPGQEAQAHAATRPLTELPARLLGAVPWLLCLTLAAVGVAGVTPLAWIGAGLVAGLSLSGSI